MNAIIFIGSRSKKGRTAQAADALAQGLKEGGAAVETVFLTEKKLERCRQCDEDGWGQCRREGHCIIKDDLQDLTDKVRDADLSVFATPVYYGDLSESLRAFLDRMRRCCWHGNDRNKFEGKKALGLCVAGGGGGGSHACAVSLERVLHSCGFDVVDVIPARRQNLELKLPVCRETGKWLAALPDE